LVTANEGSNNVSVLLGDGTGNFGTATSFSVGGSHPIAVAVGDFNGDGKQDLAVPNFGSSNVSILLGDGAGGFGSATNFSVGLSPFGVVVGDFDGDGKQDLVTGNWDSNDVSILLRDCPPPPGNTQPNGPNPVTVSPAPGVTVTFSTVTAAGDTTATIGGPPAPPNFELDGVVYDIATTASFTPPVTICLPFSATDVNPRLLHFEDVPPQQWVDRTTSVDFLTHTVCRTVSSLSPFGVFTPVATPTNTHAIATSLTPAPVGGCRLWSYW
jgi:hypothetical protein